MSYVKASTLGVVARIVTVGCRLITLPLVLGLLDKERYGLWLVIGSFLSWLALTDFGVPSALQNPLIEALAQGDRARSARLILHALKFLAKIAIALACIIIPSIFLLPVGQWMSVSPVHEREFVLVLAASVLVLCLSIPLRVTNIVAYSVGRPHYPPLMDIGVQVISLLLLVVCAWTDFSSLFALLISANLVQLLMSFAFFRNIMRGSGLAAANVEGIHATPEERRRLHSKGLLFLLVLIGEGLVLQSDAFIIGLSLSPADVANYLIPNTLFMQFLMLQNAFLRPLWPVFTQSHASGDMVDIRNILRKGLGLSLVAAIAFGLGFGLLGNWFVRLWTHGDVSVSPLMAWGFAAYAGVASLTNVLAVFCNAVGWVGRRLYAIVGFGVLKVIGGCLCLQLFTLSALPLCYAIICFCTELIMLTWLARRYLREQAVLNSTKLFFNSCA